MKIILLVGGASPEREVSKLSSASIYEALISLGHDVILIDPAYGADQPENTELFFSKEDHAEVSARNYVTAVDSKKIDEADLVFIGLHGKYGEDGAIQSLLDLRGVKYTGSGVTSSAVAMDKSLSKVLFQHYDVSTPPWFLVGPGERDYNLIKAKIKKFFGYPCIVKPNDQGSTIGLSVCRGDIEVKEAIEKASKYSEKLIIEEFIRGHEVAVTIVGKEVMPVLEIIPSHNLYDYECKYTDGMSRYEVPAKFPKKVVEHLKHQALLAYNSVGCKSYGRADFRLSEKMVPYCLEMNTLPGMTKLSLVPKMARSAGLSFETLIERIIKSTLG